MDYTRGREGTKRRDEREPRKSLQKHGFPQLELRKEGVESLWPPKCGGGCESLSKGKDFKHNVEAHESTCHTWPTD
jgi:hypothetical protein